MKTTITRRKWTWTGHTMRKAGSSITKKALEMDPSGLSRQRKTKNTWKRTDERELERSKEQGTRSGGVSSAACAPAGVERQRRRKGGTEKSGTLSCM